MIPIIIQEPMTWDKVEVPVDMDWVRDRSGQIALEINGIEKEITDLKELTSSTAPSTPTP